MIFTKFKNNKIIKRIVSGIVSAALVFAVGSPFKSINAFADETDEYLYQIDKENTKPQGQEEYYEYKYCLCSSVASPSYYIDVNGEKIPNYNKRVLLSDYGGYVALDKRTNQEKTVTFDEATKIRILKIIVASEDIFNYKKSKTSDFNQQRLESERQWLIDNVDYYDSNIKLGSDEELEWLTAHFKKLYETGKLNKKFSQYVTVETKDENGNTYVIDKPRYFSDIYEDYAAKKISKSEYKSEIKAMFYEGNKYRNESYYTGTQNHIWCVTDALTDNKEWTSNSQYRKKIKNNYLYNSFDPIMESDDYQYSYWNMVGKPVTEYIDSLPNYFDEGWNTWVYMQTPENWALDPTQPMAAKAFKTGADYISIEKTDENGTRLIGAVLQLIDMNPESPNYQKALQFREENGILIYDESGEIDHWTSNKEPQKIKGIKLYEETGLYAVREVKAPNTYNSFGDKPLQLLKHTFGDEAHPYPFSYKDTRGFVLPETGGIGTETIVAFGSVILVAGLLLGSKRKSSKKDQNINNF